MNNIIKKYYRTKILYFCFSATVLPGRISSENGYVGSSDLGIVIYMHHYSMRMLI